jgi:VanZ family protein
MKQYFRCIPLLIWCGIIIFGSSQSAVSVTETRDLDIFIHKLAHITEYAILYILFIYAFFTTRRSYPQLAVAGLLFVFLFGLSDEFHQLLTPTRGPRVSDAFVDLAGGIVGYLLTKIYIKKRSS